MKKSKAPQRLPAIKTGKPLALFAFLVLFGVAGLVTISRSAAAPGDTMCITFGNGYCLNTSSFDIGKPVYTSNGAGRTIEWDPSGNRAFGEPSGVLRFSNATNRCIIAGAGGKTQVGHCSGDTGSVWTRTARAGISNQYVFENVHYSSATTESLLACKNTVGSQCATKTSLTGEYAVFSFFKQS